MTKLVPLADLTREFGASRFTMAAKAKAGTIRVAARTAAGRLLITEAEAERLRALHSARGLVRRYERVGWPSAAVYMRARRAGARAQRQAQQQGAAA